MIDVLISLLHSGGRKLKSNIAYIDGSSAGMYGYYYKGKTMIVKTKPLTNNQAEWLGLYSLLSDLPHNWNGIIYSDSLLVVNQWKGVYRIKNEQLKEIANTCRQLVIVKHLHFSLEWISREKNIFGKILERELRKRKRLNGKKKGKDTDLQDIIPI